MEIAVVTQGRSLDEAAKNLSEAVRLHLGGEDPETTGVVAEPRIEMLYDMVLACPA
jgi:predicted RNase H-like HicB family nuclease